MYGALLYRHVRTSSFPTRRSSDLTVLNGRKIFVVEDEPLILRALEDMLENMCCALAVSASKLALGLQLAEAVVCEVAILDININGERSEPIAALLAQRGIPCIYATGYGRAGIGAPADALVIEKPYKIGRAHV